MPPVGSERYAMASTLKKPASQPTLEELYLLRHRARCDVQFLGCAHETLMAGRSLECAQGCKWRHSNFRRLHGHEA